MRPVLQSIQVYEFSSFTGVVVEEVVDGWSPEFVPAPSHLQSPSTKQGTTQDMGTLMLSTPLDVVDTDMQTDEVHIVDDKKGKTQRSKKRRSSDSFKRTKLCYFRVPRGDYIFNLPDVDLLRGEFTRFGMRASPDGTQKQFPKGCFLRAPKESHFEVSAEGGIVTFVRAEVPRRKLRSMGGSSHVSHGDTDTVVNTPETMDSTPRRRDIFEAPCTPHFS